MLLTEINALFIHIPKTGGNSVQNILAPFAEDQKVTPGDWQDGVERFELRHESLPTRKHSTLAEYRECLDEALFERLFKFTVIRSTYERVMSFYFSPHRGEVEWDRDEFLRFIKTIKPVRDFIAFPGQSLSKAVSNMDYLLDFDNLKQDFDRLARRLEVAGMLGHQNRSRHQDPLLYYDRGLTGAVKDQFREEIDYFGFRAPVTL